MKLDKEQVLKIDSLKKDFRCAKNYCCVNYRAEKLSDNDERRSQKNLKCFEMSIKSCSFSYTFRDTLVGIRYCLCPLRVYLVQEILNNKGKKT